MKRSLPPIDFAPELPPLRRTVWLIFLCAAMILLVLLGSNGLIASEEDAAEGIRELLAGIDIFSTANSWQPDEYSPLWFCRLRTLPAMLMGNSEWSCRILTLIPALLLLGGTMLLAEEYFDRQVVCCAAWMLIGSYGFIFWGRSACSFITLTAWVVWSAVALSGGEKILLRRTVFAFLFFSGSAWWGMHYLLTLPGICLAVSGSWRNKRIWQWQMIPAAAGAFIAVSALLAWCVSYPGLTFEDYLWRLWRQISLSFMESWSIAVWPGSGNHFKQILNLPRMLFPWTLPVFGALAWMGWQWRELDDNQRRWFAGTLLILLMIGIFPGRRWAYQLSLLPFMLILCGVWFSGAADGERLDSLLNTVMKWGLSLFCSFAVSVIFIFPVWEIFLGSRMPLWIMVGIPLLGLAGLAFMIFDTGLASSVERISGINCQWGGVILAGVSLSAALFAIGVAELGIYRGGRPFWRHCGEYVRQLPAEEVIFYGKSPNSMARYYMELPEKHTIVYDGNELHTALKNIPTGEAVIIFESPDLPSVKNLLAEVKWDFIGSEPLATDMEKVNEMSQYEKHYQLWRIGKMRKTTKKVQ